MQMGGGNFEGNGSVQKLDRGEACTTVHTYSETHYTVYLKWVSCAVYKFYLKKALKTKKTAQIFINIRHSNHPARAPFIQHRLLTNR